MIEAREGKRCLAGATFRDDIAPAEHRFLVGSNFCILQKTVQGDKNNVSFFVGNGTDIFG